MLPEFIYLFLDLLGIRSVHIQSPQHRRQSQQTHTGSNDLFGVELFKLFDRTVYVAIYQILRFPVMQFAVFQIGIRRQQEVQTTHFPVVLAGFQRTCMCNDAVHLVRCERFSLSIAVFLHDLLTGFIRKQAFRKVESFYKSTGITPEAISDSLLVLSEVLIPLRQSCKEQETAGIAGILCTLITETLYMVNELTQLFLLGVGVVADEQHRLVIGRIGQCGSDGKKICECRVIQPHRRADIPAFIRRIPRQLALAHAAITGNAPDTHRLVTADKGSDAFFFRFSAMQSDVFIQIVQTAAPVLQLRQGSGVEAGGEGAPIPQ